MPERRDAINVYHCETCGGDTVTVNLDAGVTPMFLRCRAKPVYAPCEGTAVSRGYRVPQDLVPTHGWYSPGKGAQKRMDPNWTTWSVSGMGCEPVRDDLLAALHADLLITAAWLSGPEGRVL